MLTAPEITRLLDIANAGVNKGQIALARRIYEGILEGHPDHAPTKISLALSRIAVGEYAAADEALQSVLAKNAEDWDALAYLGLSAKLAGREEEAEALLNRIPESAPAHALAKSLLEAAQP